MHLNNAMALNNSISKYFNHNEQACAMAAEAYYRLSGQMAAVCVTSGPGGTNTLTGVLGSWQESIPMIIISGQVREEISVEASNLNLRYRGIQEFDIINSVKNMTKYSKKITNPLSIKHEIVKAVKLANNGRKGPVWLDIPLDVQSAVIDEKDMLKEDCLVENESQLDEIDYENIIENLKTARRPIILAGRGIVSSGSLALFRKFCLDLGVPVISTSISVENMYRDNNLFYGFAGILGNRTGNFIIQNADFILALGTSFGFTLTGYDLDTFAPNATIISVDIDSDEVLKPGLSIDRHIKLDLRDFFEGISEFTEKINIQKEWIKYCDEAKLLFSPFENVKGISDDDRVSCYKFWQVLEKYEPENAIYALGNNSANSAKLQIGMKSKGQRVLTNKNCGSMGYDLPAAIGASIALNKKEVYCITGDGSIMMNLQELQTIVHYNLPIKIVIFSNDGYNAIRQTCKNFFDGVYIGCTSDTGVSFPNFENIANCFDFEYGKCTKNAELDDMISWFISSNGRAILEIEQRFDDPILPKLMSNRLPDGSLSKPMLHDMYPFLDEQKVNYMMRFSMLGD